jgi:hypothetical protein
MQIMVVTKHLTVFSGIASFDIATQTQRGVFYEEGESVQTKG